MTLCEQSLSASSPAGAAIRPRLAGQTRDRGVVGSRASAHPRMCSTTGKSRTRMRKPSDDPRCSSSRASAACSRSARGCPANSAEVICSRGRCISAVDHNGVEVLRAARPTARPVCRVVNYTRSKIAVSLAGVVTVRDSGITDAEAPHVCGRRIGADHTRVNGHSWGLPQPIVRRSGLVLAGHKVVSSARGRAWRPRYWG